MEHNKRAMNVRCYSKRIIIGHEENTFESFSNDKPNNYEEVDPLSTAVRNEPCSNEEPIRCFVCLESQKIQDYNDNYNVHLPISDTTMKYISEQLSPDIITSLISQCSSPNSVHCKKCLEISCDISKLWVKLAEIQCQINSSVMKYIQRVTKHREQENCENEEGKYSIRISENIFCGEDYIEDPSPMEYVTAAYEDGPSPGDLHDYEIISLEKLGIQNGSAQISTQNNLLAPIPVVDLTEESSSRTQRENSKTDEQNLSNKGGRRRRMKKGTSSFVGDNTPELKIVIDRVVPLECTLCKKMFVSKKSLETHKKSMRSYSVTIHPTLKCSSCKIPMNVMKTYQKGKSGTSSVRCPQCKEGFIDGKVAKSCKNLMANWSPTYVTRSNKNADNQTISVESQLTKENANLKKSFSCNNTSTLSSTSTTIEKNISLIQCEKCGERFVTASLLSTHEKTNPTCDFAQYDESNVVSPAFVQSQVKRYLMSSIFKRSHQNRETEIEPENGQGIQDGSLNEPQQILDGQESHAPPAPGSKLLSLKCMTCNNSLEHYAAKPEMLAKGQRAGTAPFYCSNCKKVFILATRSEAVNAINYVKPKPKKVEEIKSARKIMEHEKNMKATDENKYTCCDCSGKFVSGYILLVHRKLHCAQITKTCNICNIRFDFNHQLKDHMELKHPKSSEANGKTCYKCNTNYTDEQNHQSKCTGTPEKKCEKCDCVFFTENALYKHLRFVHKESLKVRINDKRQTHSDKRVKKKNCDLCGTVVNEKTIKLHKRHCVKRYAKEAKKQKKLGRKA